MSFLERVLDPPSYGYIKNGQLYVPTKSEIFFEALKRINVFSSLKNWISLFPWLTLLALSLPMYVFITEYVNIWFILIGWIYSMVIMGSFGTFWFHRYCTHRAFKFKNYWIMLLCKNLAIRLFPEELYVISHHVHHKLSDLPGDPYNPRSGSSRWQINARS